MARTVSRSRSSQRRHERTKISPQSMDRRANTRTNRVNLRIGHAGVGAGARAEYTGWHVGRAVPRTGCRIT